LLGIYPGYKKLKKITSEVVIIDESSMISLFLFYQLMNAIDISNIRHMVFIGDVNQLPSVEVGNVFKKKCICHKLI
jgi:exodeoxyribonuclease V alpha subunit